SISHSAGFSSSISFQVSNDSSDSVAPAGLGYKATTRPCWLLLKKKAMLIGIISPSHWLSVIRKSAKKRMRRGTRLYLVWPWLPKRIAQASHAQISLRLMGSRRCWWLAANSWLHISQLSLGEGREE